MFRIIPFLTVFFFSFNVFSQTGDPVKEGEKFKAALAIINSGYVDTANISRLTEDAIVKVLQDLDPHSVYISKEELEEMNEPLVGNFDGIGVSFQILQDTIFVIQVIPGGPSEKIGLAAGDKIIKINGENVAGTGIKNNDVMKKLRGTKGTKVTVTIARTGAKAPLDFTIVRDKIPLTTVDASYMASPAIGYIKVNRFAQNTMDEFTSSLRDLKTRGMKDLILDLRGNGGGYLHMAIALADEFLPANKMIVYTEGLHQPRQESYATARGEFEQGKLVILIDHASASASEIVSGAVQDWDRALIIGRRSFGKGLVQKPYNLPDGSVIRLTTARYYTPTGRSIQKPYTGGIEEYYSDINNRYKHGEFSSIDSIKLIDSLRFYTPAKRVVYGGGGIMPDVFVPWDTTGESEFLTDIIRLNLLNQFTIYYLDRNRSELLKKYPTVQDYKKNFTITPEFFNEFIAYTEKSKAKKTDKDVVKSRKRIEQQLKAVLARNLWNLNAYYEVSNEDNEDYRKAVQALQDNTFSKLNLTF